jgi:hypothetical protein
VLAVGVDAGQGIQRFLTEGLVEAFLHQLGVAERCSKLVAHVGDELRLVLTGDLKIFDSSGKVPRPAFSIAMIAWSAKISTSSICLWLKGLTSVRARERTARNLSLTEHRHPEHCAGFGLLPPVKRRELGFSKCIGSMDCSFFKQDETAIRAIPRCHGMIIHPLNK